MRTRIFFTVLLTLSLTGAASAQLSDKAKLDQFFDRLAEKNKAMGSLVVAKDGTVIYSRTIGYGKIDDAEKKPLTVESRFRIGSITKMFTAAIVLKLVEEGKLKLTDTLDIFFPQIANAQKITIGQILAHRSGIHDSMIDPTLRSGPRTKAITKDETLAIIAKGTPDFEPDAQYRYSNSGYTLLGMIIEKVTQKPYDQAVKEKITLKIGLKDTYVTAGNIDVSKNEAVTYLNLGDGWRTMDETHPTNLFSAGAIVSTPYDLVKFIQALFDGKLISAKSLAVMNTIRDGEGAGMGTFALAGKTFYGHTGGADNYGAWLAYLPEEKLAFAYTTNAKVYPVKDIIGGLVDIYYNRPFQIPTFESFAISTDVLDKYVGTYSAEGVPASAKVTREGTTLFFQPPGAPAGIRLEATAQDKFKIDNGTATGIVIEFDIAKGQMKVKRGDGERVFTKAK